MPIGCTTLAALARLRPFTSRRASSFDRRGGNRDALPVAAGGRLVLADLAGPGCIKHFWSTNSHAHDRDAMRSTVLRIWWDDERRPSVEVPLADFFGGSFGICRQFVSLPLQMNPDGGRGMNCWFPMPFRRRARVEVRNEWREELQVFYYLDYEEYRQPDWPQDLAYFHAQWRRANPTPGWGRLDLKGPANQRHLERYWKTRNVSGAGNYVLLEARGRGQYVGCHLDIDCFAREKNDWYGEGDDMIFIDGEPWPPRLHGTGTEDYFTGAYCPRQPFSTPYAGITQYSGSPEWGPRDWPFRGKNSMYRFHIEDPIRFEKSIRVTIEHGHNNKLSNDYSSTAYWYQVEPHAPFPKLPAARLRLARPDWPAFTPAAAAPAQPPETPRKSSRRRRGKPGPP